MATLRKRLVVPSDQEAKTAYEAAYWTAIAARQSAPVRIGRYGHEIEFPKAAIKMLARMLTAMSRGNGVSLATIPEEVGSVKAAEMLGMTHKRLSELLDSEWIPSRKVGNLRRVFLRDLAPKLA